MGIEPIEPRGFGDRTVHQDSPFTGDILGGVGASPAPMADVRRRRHCARTHNHRAACPGVGDVMGGVDGVHGEDSIRALYTP